jgi:hypothetical protein
MTAARTKYYSSQLGFFLNSHKKLCMLFNKGYIKWIYKKKQVSNTTWLDFFNVGLTEPFLHSHHLHLHFGLFQLF